MLVCLSWRELIVGVLYSQLPVLPVVEKKYFSVLIEQPTYFSSHPRHHNDLVIFIPDLKLTILKKVVILTILQMYQLPR